MGSFSKKGNVKVGKPNPAMEMCFELEICPDLILAGIAAAAAAAFAILFTEITMAGRKRRRALDSYEPVSLSKVLEDLYASGNVIVSPVDRFFPLTE